MRFRRTVGEEKGGGEIKEVEEEEEREVLAERTGEIGGEGLRGKRGGCCWEGEGQAEGLTKGTESEGGREGSSRKQGGGEELKREGGEEVKEGEVKVGEEGGKGKWEGGSERQEEEGEGGGRQGGLLKLVGEAGGEGEE